MVYRFELYFIVSWLFQYLEKLGNKFGSFHRVSMQSVEVVRHNPLFFQLNIEMARYFATQKL